MQTAARTDESALVAALRAGDERAFMELVEAYTPGMRRLALTFVRTGSVADEVVQESWLGVLRGLDRFEGRSAQDVDLPDRRERRANPGCPRGAQRPFSSFAGDDEASVDPERFAADGHWASPVEPWQAVLDAEARGVIDRAIAALPEQQRQVIELRDVQGWPSEEVCNVLELSETNQRVLLHRARSKVRAALDEYLEKTDDRTAETEEADLPGACRARDRVPRPHALAARSCTLRSAPACVHELHAVRRAVPQRPCGSPGRFKSRTSRRTLLRHCSPSSLNGSANRRNAFPSRVR